MPCQNLPEWESILSSAAHLQQIVPNALDGIETGVRQLIREAPLETAQIGVNGKFVVLPTKAEMLCIKAVLILKRNATRDYPDFAALAMTAFCLHCQSSTNCIRIVAHKSIVSV